MSEENGASGKIWSRFAWGVGVISAVLGIYVFINDEVRARIFPDQNGATRADVKEQLQLSEVRIASLVEASITSALQQAEARGDNISVDERDNFEAALTSLLSSEDPALSSAKLLAASGQAQAAAEKLVNVAEPTAAGDTIPARGRADVLRSAGDILVPSDPRKALSAYEKALELDPDNPVLKTRVQTLKAQTAEKNAVQAIPGANFELSGLRFQFEGCENPEAPVCVLSVMNTTPDAVNLSIGKTWAINEQGRWMSDRSHNIVASSRTSWEIPSLEASRIELKFNRNANVFQLIRFEVNIKNIEFNKEFRDIAIRGGRQVQVREMRPVDENHPEYAYQVDGVQVHFLGCSNPDAPVCRFDLLNTSKDDLSIVTRGGLAFDSESIQQKSAKSVLSLEGKSDGELPPGIVASWEVTFRSEAEFLQAFWPDLRIEGKTFPRSFTSINLGDTEPPAIKSLRRDQAFEPEGIFEAGGFTFVFLGCRNPVNPTCTFDVRNTTDEAVRLIVNRSTASHGQDSDVRSSSNVIEMSGKREAIVPAGLVTTFEVSFRNEMPMIDKLLVPVSIGSDGFDIDYSAIPLMAP